MLSNAYFLAKFRFDTAENEPAKNLLNFRKMHFSKMHFSGGWRLTFSSVHNLERMPARLLSGEPLPRTSTSMAPTSTLTAAKAT